MPEAVEECKESVLEDNPSYSESRAYAICWAQQNKGNLGGANLSDDELLAHVAQKDLSDADGCEAGYVKVGERCVPIEEVADVPPSALDLSTPRVMASGRIDTEPIKREDLGDGRVKYSNIKLVSEGVWTDQNSKTPTLYDERTFENVDPEYPREFDGPPANIAHDIHKDGPKAGEPHEASIGGYIEPDSVRTDGEALFGDIILDTEDAAGAFADENLKSALENDGTAGFSPSVELMPTELREAEHPHAEEHVAAAELTGVGLVRDPASETVDLRHETQNRAVAMAANGRSDKARVYQRRDMSADNDVTDEIRAEVLSRELSIEDVESDAENIADELDVDVAAVMEVLEPLLEMPDEDEDGEGAEMEDGEDDEEEDDEDKEMQEEALEGLREQIDDLWAEIEDLKDGMATEEEMTSNLEDAKADLAAADTVTELREAKEELDKRLSKIEEQDGEKRTMSESNSEFEPTYDDGPASTSSWQ
jgi:hypothetical protein